MLTFAIIVIITLCTWTMTIVKILCISTRGRNKKCVIVFIYWFKWKTALFKCLNFFFTTPPLPNLFIKAWLLPSSITWLCIRISRIGVSIWIFIALKWGNKLIYYYACAKYITDNCCTYNQSPQQLTWLL